jgi:hypothetical protein
VFALESEVSCGYKRFNAGKIEAATPAATFAILWKSFGLASTGFETAF